MREARELIPPQLPFDKLKRISSRLMIIDSHAALPIDATAQEVNAMRHVEARVLLADEGWTEDRSGDALDDHLGNVFTEVKRVSAETRALDRVAEPVVARIQERIARVDCKRCAGGGAPCGPGSTSNHANLARGGECIRELKQQFLDACATVRALVARWQPEHTTRGPELQLAIRHSSGAPHGLAIHYMVSGEHTSEDLDNRARGVVKLIFDIDELDDATYHATTYVLFHELICHAWDGIVAPPRTKATDSDGFADGWMDFVAARTVASWLHGRLGTLPDPPTSPYDRETIAWTFHRARIEVPRGKITGPAHQRAAGAQAAQRFLARLADDHGNALELLIGWSLYLSIHRPARRGLFLRWNHAHPSTAEVIDAIGRQQFAAAWRLIERGLPS